MLARATPARETSCFQSVVCSSGRSGQGVRQGSSVAATQIVAALSSDTPRRDDDARRTVDEAAVLPCGADEITAVIEGHVAVGVTKFVLGPADRPADWADELAWLREVTGPLER